MMQNTYMTPLRYKNWATPPVEKSVKLHFHLTPREFADWLIDNKDEADRMLSAFTDMRETMEQDPDGEATEAQKRTMLRLVRILAELSYGVPQDDGEVFDKSGNQKFIYSAAYDAFRLFLFENLKELVTFIETLLNEDVIKEFSERISASNEPAVDDQEQKLQISTKEKDPKEMTHEELLAAYKARNRE